MGSKVENLKIWQVGYQFTEKFSEKFNESVKKIFFWCASTPQNPRCIVYHNSLKMNFVYSGSELLKQLGLLPGLKMNEIGWPNHRKLNFYACFILNNP